MCGKNMRYALTIISLMMASLVYSSTEILNLKAEYSSGAVKIQWQSGIEINVKEFRIEKSSDNVIFNVFTTQMPQGSSSQYTLIDLNPHSKDTFLYYRIVVKDYDGSENISNSVKVRIETSGIGYTWGSIKALFR